MKKLYVKMIFSTTLITIFVISVFRAFFVIFERNIIGTYSNSQIVLVSMIIIGSIILVLSNLWFNFMFIRRLSYLTRATKNISQGNFNEHLEEYGCDEISQLTHHFNVMTDALKDNQYVNQSFMKDYAHEFKTPISIIKGYGELIEQSSDLDEIKHYAEIIVNESNQLSQLAQNILEISLLDREPIVDKKDEFNISETCRYVIQSLQPKWEEKSLDLDLDLEHINIISNKELVYIMLKNLIDNAIKYADEASKLNIKIYKDDNIHIDIINQGPKIDAKDMSKIFELFYRSEHTKDRDGHGVGLSIVEKIVKKLDYKIDVESNDSYTRFSVMI